MNTMIVRHEIQIALGRSREEDWGEDMEIEGEIIRDDTHTAIVWSCYLRCS